MSPAIEKSGSPSNQLPQPPQVHKGLDGILADETRISEVDGQLCQLIYQGYNIDELIGNATYEEVGYLLLHGKLPDRSELSEWTKQLETHRVLEPQIASLLEGFPRQASPMALLRTAISALALYDKEEDQGSLDAIRRQALRVIAKAPTIVATIGRLHAGKSLSIPKQGLSHAGDFLYMLHGKPPSDDQTRALDAYFILLADHSFNASTFTARTVTSTQSDYYSAIAAAIGTLKGPLHGAANRKAMEMLIEIGSAENVEPYVKQTMADHKRFMGFGHRVYKGPDPRAKHLKIFAKQLGESTGDLKWFAISEKLQDAVWKAKQLYINVDFYSASLLYYLGIPVELFTAMFACARMVGWSAHVIEQAENNRLIRPLALYIGLRNLKFVPIDKHS